MPDRRRSWKTDSQWLRLSLAATGLGVSLIVASAAAWKSSPVTYVGATLAFVGAYLACAVLVFPLPLPMLLSNGETELSVGASARSSSKATS